MLEAPSFPRTLVPLPVPEITREWVLCHECYLRKVLPVVRHVDGLADPELLLEIEAVAVLA